MRRALVLCLAVVGACLTILLPAVTQHQHPAGNPEKLGAVDFSISCNSAVQSQFNRAVAMLHSFWYEKANEAFAAVAREDPTCGMAYWGIALTHIRAAELKEGWAATQKAKAVGAKTDREKAYIAAIESFFKDFDKLDYYTRALAYEKAMEQLHLRYPEDHEAALFYALALLRTAWASSLDKDLTRQKKAGAIAEEVFAMQPDHPGAAHYVLHSYDYPSLAHRALAAARRYAEIAPGSPHALHMPSHIFTRLGLWQESIQSNLASAAAARKQGDTEDELHAMDFLMYAYLQLAQDREAKKLLEEILEMKQTSTAYVAGLYATAAIPARHAVERRRWAEAATLTPRADAFPGGRYSWGKAIIYFASALGSARSGDAAAARKAVQHIASARDTLTQAKEDYWATEVEILRLAATGWLAHAEGKNEEALALMRLAAELEDSTEKHPVTPGAIIPARELLGYMLLEVNQPTQALIEFKASLQRSPNRFNALYGVARSAQLSGDPEKAAKFYGQLAEMCRKGDDQRTELREAKAFLRLAINNVPASHEKY